MPLAIADIEKARGRFYAPAFAVTVAGKDVVRDLLLEITSVRVEQTLEGADRFSFVVNNGWDISKREFLKIQGRTLPEFFEFGSQVEVRMGYGDRAGLDLMLMGIVTELSTSFPSSGLPQLTISGYDHSYRLMKGSESQNWENKKDSDVANEKARLYNLTATVQDTKVVHPKVEKRQESAAQFLRAWNGFFGS